MLVFSNTRRNVEIRAVPLFRRDDRPQHRPGHVDDDNSNTICTSTAAKSDMIRVMHLHGITGPRDGCGIIIFFFLQIAHDQASSFDRARFNNNVVYCRDGQLAARGPPTFFTWPALSSPKLLRRFALTLNFLFSRDSAVKKCSF